MSLRSLRAALWFVWGGSIATTGALGCAPPDDDPGLYEEDEQVAEVKQSIQGGYTDDADLNVVGVAHFSKGAICTGSLIAPNMVLTARHCVSDLYGEAGNGGIICDETRGTSTWSVGGFGVTTVTDMYNADYSDFVGVIEVITTPGNDMICGADQAILILEGNFDPQQVAPLTPRVDSKLAPNEEYYAIGYGQSSDGNYNSSGIRRRRDGLRVSCAEDDCTGMSYYMTVQEWQGDTGICSGDSGGPAPHPAGPVVGVTSRGSVNCDEPIYGSVHQWGEWIKETALHAAEVGGYEPAAWVTGFPTDPKFNAPIGGNCEENGCGICWKNECTRYCADNAPCPDGYECDEVQEGTSVCVEIPPPPPPGDGGDGGGDTAEDDGCTVASSPGADPTNPVPWLLGVGALALVAARRRRVAR